MTTQTHTPSAQQETVLTDEQIDSLADTHDLPFQLVRSFARSIEIAALYAKLYAAPVASQASEADKAIDEALAERDEREEIIDKLLDLVLGVDRPEWSSAYDYQNALIEVEDHMHGLAVKEASAVLADRQKRGYDNTQAPDVDIAAHNANPSYGGDVGVLLSEVSGYLTCVEDGSMSRNNAESLAVELRGRIAALLVAPKPVNEQQGGGNG